MQIPPDFLLHVPVEELSQNFGAVPEDLSHFPQVMAKPRHTEKFEGVDS